MHLRMQHSRATFPSSKVIWLEPEISFPKTIAFKTTRLDNNTTVWRKTKSSGTPCCNKTSQREQITVIFCYAHHLRECPQNLNLKLKGQLTLKVDRFYFLQLFWQNCVRRVLIQPATGGGIKMIQIVEQSTEAFYKRRSLHLNGCPKRKPHVKKSWQNAR